MQTDHLPNNVTPPPAPPAGGGGGVCLKCGYSFPKQNPSSKQRRAHRKICPGNTLEVPAPHQLQASYSFVSANDHPSDDDGEFKTPSPSVLERSQFEMGSGGTGGKSNRSEDDVFSDAVTDFVDPGSSALGLQQRLKEEEERFKGAIKDKDIEGPVDGTTDETTQMQISEVEEVYPDTVGPASEECVPTVTAELTERSYLDGTIKEPGDVSGDIGRLPMSDLNPMIPKNHINDPGEETPNSVHDLSDTYRGYRETTPEVHIARDLNLSGDNDIKLSEGMANIEKTVIMNSNTGDISKLDDENTTKPTSGSGDAGLVPMSDLNPMLSKNEINDPEEVTPNSVSDLFDTYRGNGESTSEVPVAAGLDLSGDSDVKLPEGMPNIEKMVVVNSNTADISKLDDENTAKPTSGSGDAAHCDKAEEVHQLKHDEINSYTDDVKSADNISASVDKVDDKEDAPEAADFASPNESVEGFNCKDDGNAHVLSVNDDITYVVNAEAMIKGFKGEGNKDDDPEVADFASPSESVEGFNCKDDGHAHVLSVNDDITYVGNAEAMIKGFKGEGNKDDDPEVADFASPNESVEGFNCKDDGNAHVLSVNDDISYVGNAEAMIKGFKGEGNKEVAPEVADSASFNESVEGSKCTDYDNAHVLSVNDDITYVDNSEAMVKGFKGEGVKITSDNLGPDGITKDVKATEPSAENYKSISLPARQLDEGTLSSSSDIQVVGDSPELKGESSKIVAEELLDITEGKGSLLSSSEVPLVGDNLEVKGESSKLVAKALINGTEVDNSATDVSFPAIGRPGEQEFLADVMETPVQSRAEQIGDHGDDILIGSNLGSTTEISPADRDVGQLERPDDTVPDSYKVPNNEGSNVDEDNKLTLVGPHEDKNRAAAQPSNIIVENARPNLLGQLDRSDVTGTEKSDPSSVVYQNVSMKTVENLQSDTEHCSSDIGVPKQRSQEAHDIESNFLENVSTADIEGNKIDGNAAPADQIRGTTSDALVSQKSLQELVANYLLISPPHTDSKEEGAIVKDECTSDLVGDASHDKPEIFSKEGQNLAKHVGTSVTDLSVDSNSQTDSLEGQWGSVSGDGRIHNLRMWVVFNHDTFSTFLVLIGKAVLSTQSDMPVSVDGEAGSGGEAGKYSRKIRNGPPEGQETDMFEAPSFMTLVEPRRGSEEKAAAAAGGSGGASEIQNPQELKAGASPDRAGWFPSITNVVNESQGRKKNEEIIAKVTTKQQQQQHTPLKSLLGEANEEMKLRVATKKEKTEVVKTTEAGGAVRRMEEGVTVEGKEWDSSPPGREKRKVKGRPYWAHLVCCASVN
ncbi:hypothetical protein LINPERHAP1_LOCUS35240 [Linum perenne]